MADQITDSSSPAAPASSASPLALELSESRAELLNRIQNLKQDLQSWRSKLDTQVKVYREELTDLKKTLNLEVEQLRQEFKELKSNLNQQQEDVTASLKDLGLQDDYGDGKEPEDDATEEDQSQNNNVKEAEH
ncbi:PREDICTED: uncharacterized protein LOC104820261 isoform X2 [Tarenaya hassleriana]|uniref:uncharacterized protein LOC104820261 isoform X2 n=1 Tax=Tarenaya hassleriana TaxID=28532 RepID=UPI00053C7C44|nr:PREDICTED: uncharacterized protein LOC104820261 isoform X2 [Tarenaya hassleriana]